MQYNHSIRLHIETEVVLIPMPSHSIVFIAYAPLNIPNFVNCTCTYKYIKLDCIHITMINCTCTYICNTITV